MPLQWLFMYPLLCSNSSKVWKYQRSNQKRKSNKDRQWNGQKPKPKDNDIYTENQRLRKANQRKIREEFMCSEWLSRITTTLHQSILLVCATFEFSSNECKEHTLQCPVDKLLKYQFFDERWYLEEEFEDIKGAIRIRISKKNRQHNGQKKKDKRTNNDRQNIHIKQKIE